MDRYKKKVLESVRIKFFDSMIFWKIFEFFFSERFSMEMLKFSKHLVDLGNERLASWELGARFLGHFDKFIIHTYPNEKKFWKKRSD